MTMKVKGIIHRDAKAVLEQAIEQKVRELDWTARDYAHDIAYGQHPRQYARFRVTVEYEPMPDLKSRPGGGEREQMSERPLYEQVYNAIAYRFDSRLGAGEDGTDKWWDWLAVYLRAQFTTAEGAEREACARVAEEHQEHIDIGSPQDHMEPPFRCCVAEAIRARGARPDFDIRNPLVTTWERCQSLNPKSKWQRCQCDGLKSHTGEHYSGSILNGMEYWA